MKVDQKEAYIVPINFNVVFMVDLQVSVSLRYEAFFARIVIHTLSIHIQDGK